MSGRAESTKRWMRDGSSGAAFLLLLGAATVLAGCRTTALVAPEPATPVASAPAAPVAVHEPELQPVADGPPYVVEDAAPQDDRLNALLWTQTSAEYRTLAETTWSAASRALERALADPHWTAALEQTGDSAGLPPAVIVDVDETVLDNSPFEAESLLAGRAFERESWLAWIASASAPAVPGALAFARRADALGVTIFYVTNRDVGEEDGTRRNLARLGFPIHEETDTVLLRGERPAYVSDKTSRRAEIARSHRILLLAGDDLNDFVTGALDRPDRRIAVAREHAGFWGERWFLLPNPDYGSWERALYENDRGLSTEEKRRRKRMQLRTIP